MFIGISASAAPTLRQSGKACGHHDKNSGRFGDEGDVVQAGGFRARRIFDADPQYLDIRQQGRPVGLGHPETRGGHGDRVALPRRRWSRIRNGHLHDQRAAGTDLDAPEVSAVVVGPRNEDPVEGQYPAVVRLRAPASRVVGA